MTDWRPIHTAPLTGRVYIWNGQEKGLAHPCSILTRWRWSDGRPVTPNPTHWMPEPDPPQTSTR